MVGKILKVPRSFRLSRFQGNLDKLQCVVAVKKILSLEFGIMVIYFC